MKRSVRIDEIDPTPVSRERMRHSRCQWMGCWASPVSGMQLCEDHCEQAHRDREKHLRPHVRRQRDNVLDGICMWPDCDRTRSRFPDLNMCNAHLALIYGKMHKDAMEQDRAAADDKRAAALLKQREQHSVIYYVQVGAHIKIGWTSDLQSRMRNYPPNSLLLAVHPGSRADEARLHKRFAHHRTHGREWYAPVPSVLHHIAQMKAQHGEPEQVTFGAQPVTIPEPRPKQYVAARSRSGASFKRTSL